MNITMDNQQETKGLIIILVGSTETIRQELIVIDSIVNLLIKI
jgi:hypothetical protein